MALTQDQIAKLVNLLRSHEQEFVQQGMMLTETLIHDASEFSRLFKGLTTQSVPKNPSLQSMQQTFQQVNIDGFRIFERTTTLLSCWSIGMLAQWDSNIVENTLSLDLSNSQIHTLPASLQHLVRLQSLNLRRNHLKQLPKWLGTLEELRELDISKNPLQSVPNNIRTLRIDHKQWGDLQSKIWSLTSLRHLDLRECGIRRIPWMIQQLVELRTLLVAHNTPLPRRENLSSTQLLQQRKELAKKCAYLPYSLFDLPHLERLEVRLSTYSIDWLERLEHQSKTFIDLMLQTDSRTIQSTSIIEEVFPTTEQAMWALGEVVQWNAYLQSSINELDLTSTQLLEVPQGIQYLDNLSHLNLSNNHLMTIPEWLSELSNVKILVLSGNPISELPTFLEYMSHLEELHLDGTQIDPEEFIWLEALMSHCELYF